MRKKSCSYHQQWSQDQTICVDSIWQSDSTSSNSALQHCKCCPSQTYSSLFSRAPGFNLRLIDPYHVSWWLRGSLCLFLGWDSCWCKRSSARLSFDLGCALNLEMWRVISEILRKVCGPVSIWIRVWCGNFIAVWTLVLIITLRRWLQSVPWVWLL